MNARLKNIISVFFISLFLIHGLAELVQAAGNNSNKITLKADAEAGDEETAKSDGLKESSLFYNSTDTLMPGFYCIILKEKISPCPLIWKNIIRAVFTPPPEVL